MGCNDPIQNVYKIDTKLCGDMVELDKAGREQQEEVYESEDGDDEYNSENKCIANIFEINVPLNPTPEETRNKAIHARDRATTARIILALSL